MTESTDDEDFPKFIPWDGDRRLWSARLEDLWQQNCAPYEWQPPTGKGMEGAGWRRVSETMNKIETTLSQP